jgi:hypothetical protein
VNDSRAEIVAALVAVRDEIRASMQAEGVNASGRTSAALQVVEDENGVRLIKAEGQVAPMRTLEKGREGGAVPKGFAAIIRQWSIDKRIAFNSERERNSFAYLTARKIAREGTIRHKQPKEIYTAIVSQAVERLSKAIRGSVTAPILEAVHNFGK